ncbi:TPA: RNase H family protein, partial [Clostridioides difficile]
KNKLNVKFTKVKAHSGNKYNEEADKLAKKAIGV